MNKWYPIETAPKDGTLFDAYRSDWNERVTNCFWNKEEFRFYRKFYNEYDNEVNIDIYKGENLTHWTHIPDLPNENLNNDKTLLTTLVITVPKHQAEWIKKRLDEDNKLPFSVGYSCDKKIDKCKIEGCNNDEGIEVKDLCGYHLNQELNDKSPQGLEFINEILPNNKIDK